MLNVLLESKAVRTRRVGGTVTSTLVHAAIVAGGIMLTVRPNPGDARTPPKEPKIRYVDIKPSPKPAAPTPAQPRPERRSTSTTPSLPPLPTVDQIPSKLPPIDPSVPTTTEPNAGFGPGIPTTSSLGEPVERGEPLGGVVEERYVDRSPRLMGKPVQPTFPSMLRERGHNGRVVVQFVVDTLGRAEMDAFQVVEASDRLFAESVRAVLGRYRFSPGDAGGRKVRTLVRLPFYFTLVR